MTPSQTENKAAVLGSLFWSFFKIGIFTFGGGYAMILLMQAEVVDKRGWVARDKFLDLLTLAQSAPGPISLNTAVFVGYNLGRVPGAVLGLLGVVVPSFAVILLIAIFFKDIINNRVFEAAFKGMRPAVVALIAAPIFGLAKGMGVWRLVLAAVAALMVWQLHVSPIWFIVAGALGGILWLKIVGRRAAGVEGSGPDARAGEETGKEIPEYPFETPDEETFKMPEEK